MDELNIRLIDLVESEPCIYDKTDVFYSNKDHVKQVWEKISNAMQLSVPVCQKRWRYLRDYFVRQLHMSKTDNKKSYWALFERMLFLAPFSTRKARVNTTSSECCTTTSMIPGHNITTKKRRQRSTSAIIKKNWDNDQNSNILSVSSSSSNAGLDEFNSFDYLNLYQAQFGFADNAALLQLQKQTNFPLNLDDRLSSLPLEIQIRSPSSEPNNSTINFSKRSSNNTGSINDDFGKNLSLKSSTVATTISTTSITPVTSSSIQSNDPQNLIGYNLVSTSTNEQISINTNNKNNNNNKRQHRQHLKNINFTNHNDINYKLQDFATNYTNPTALLSVESHYSNSEKSPNPNSMQNDDDLKFYNNNNSNNTTTVNINNNHRYHNSRFNSIEYNKKNLITNDSIDDNNNDDDDNNNNNNNNNESNNINNKIHNNIIDNNKIGAAEDLRKIDYKNNSTKISPKMKRSTTRKRKKTDILNELLDILKKSENTNCDEHDYFFRSLLNSVRRIDENLIIPFRTEILKTVMKFREMSNSNNNSINIQQIHENNCSNNNNDTQNNNNNNNSNQQFNSIFNLADDYDDEEDVVIIDTGESNWRQKLKRY